MPPQATRVAVLGGGIGALSAAYELTRPELNGRYEVTVIQPGWRLGGKGASGRNMADGKGKRIEEHGLHLWFGFYANAFRLMHEAYAALPDDWPLRSVEEAFAGCNEVVLYDNVGEDWHAFSARWPEREGKPWEVEELPGFWSVARDALAWALQSWRGLREQGDSLDLPLVPSLVDHLLEHAVEQASRLAKHQALAGLALGEPLHWFISLLGRIRRGIVDALGEHLHNPRLRLFVTTFDAFVSMATGIVVDDIMSKGWHSVDDQEWAEWMRHHGASTATVGDTPAERAPVLRAVYDLAFGYREGDVDKPDMSAGTATNDLLLLMFTYRGHFFYKMRAGMGDIVFAPLYEVLRGRHVDFRFFTAVRRVGVGADGRSIAELDIVTQAELAPGRDRYEPLVPVNRLPCWPSEPLWDQLADGEGLAGTDFEGEIDPLNRGTETLRRGRDFDEVVLGIPVGAHREVCAELIDASPEFKQMVEGSHTVRTQGFQLWLRASPEELGWDKAGPASVAGSYVEPLDTFCDMTHLVAAEEWPAEDEVKTIAYVCGVLDESAADPAAATESTRAQALGFLRDHVAPIWPKAASGSHPSPLRWELLVGEDHLSGEERFSSQYWRANTSGWERYVLTPAGSIPKRLAPGNSGFENLYLAGDWTKNGIDGGCVEAAATSGIQAAAALRGEAAEIVGQDPRWLHPNRSGRVIGDAGKAEPAKVAAGLPAYVEFGGQASNPGPFKCTDGRLRGFLLEGKRELIDELIGRTLTEPANGGIEYRPVGSTVVLLVGTFGSLTSTVEPWSTWGSARETQASLWIPMVAGQRRGTRFDAAYFCMAVPYMWVDNPMSYSGGREDYGYPKTQGRFEPADATGDSIVISAFGGRFRPDAVAAWHPVIEVSASAAAEESRDHGLIEDVAGLALHVAGASIRTARDVGEAVAGALAGALRGNLPAVADVNLLDNFVESLLKGEGRQVFLKQFRDAADGTRACYQAVIEAPVKVTRVRGKPSLRSWDVKINELDSHPVARELGVTSQRAKLGFELEIDFVLEAGKAVQPAA